MLAAGLKSHASCVGEITKQKQIRQASKMSDEKGETIRLVGGKYEGKTGWLNASKTPHPPLYWYVIIAEKDDKERITRVRRTSVKLASEEVEPTSYEEACLRQHPDIEAAMDKLARDLAKCSVGNSQEISRLVQKKLAGAIVAQRMQGNKASWRHVDYQCGEREWEEQDLVDI
jgi:hypothetical protein